jgi:hypothetical protein
MYTKTEVSKKSIKWRKINVVYVVQNLRVLETILTQSKEKEDAVMLVIT